MAAELDLEVIRKRSKKKEFHPIFTNFRVKKFTIKYTQKETTITLMFEHYNLVDLVE
jgi:hypothetical protein